MVLADKGGVAKLLPVANKFPPEAVSYHSIVPPAAVAVKFAFEPRQTDVPLAVGDEGTGLTVTVTGVRELAQPLLEIVWT